MDNTYNACEIEIKDAEQEQIGYLIAGGAQKETATRAINGKESSATLAGYGDLLSVSELAEIFRVSKQTVYKELRAGKFGEPIRIGRAFLIPKIHIYMKYFNTA